MERILSEVYIHSDGRMKKYVCIWDTGAVETMVSENVISDFNPDKYGYVFIKSIHKETKSDKYLLNLLLEGHKKSIRINPACFGKSDKFDILIGMDIISNGRFLLENNVFSFNIDSLK